LPPHRTTDFSSATVTVTRSGTISVRNVLYTVPSRLVGCRVKVHIYDDRLVCYLGTTPVLTVARRYFKRNGPRQRVVDYRHLIGALIRKPQAFRHSVFRDELFPSSIFRRTWETLDQRLDPQKACRVYVGLPHLAAMQGCEMVLADHLAAGLDAGGTPDLEAARTAVVPPIITAPAVMVMAPDLAAYTTNCCGCRPWEMPSERRRRRQATGDAECTAPADDWPHLAGVQRPRRPRGLGQRTLPRRDVRPRTGRARRSAHRASYGRIRPAARQDPRYPRLRRRADHSQGPCDGAGRGRGLDRARWQSADLRPSGTGKNASGHRLRHRPGR
jgi:Mu transposase, C-terminal domain